ncbi:SMAD/FHA domain-containing protein [Schizopora paradoxa]|uniref:SMAD/FHA domain-containing protein n=1 Tax=Schizopora paradoxa TaxID=27342 RepID=A0A0H2RC92_9AGAM|nr:SMAD/FHA domain-containing protein [Schizopora paradoxa]
MSGKGRSRSPSRRDRERSSRYDDDDDRRGPSSKPRRSEEPKRRYRDDYDEERYEDRKRPRGSYDERRRYDNRREDRRSERSRSRERERRRDNEDDKYRERKRDDRETDRDRDRQEGPSSSRRPARDSPAGSRARSRSPSRSVSAEVDKDMGKPNFKNSGLLAAATNTVQLTDGTSTVLKYNEPPEARKPTVGWRLYVFKGDEQSDPLHINRQSCYLIGRDRAITDIFVEHPSCSKQHAAIQHRQIKTKDEFGSIKTAIKPFIIDLESTNGTLVNDEKIPAARYYEIQPGDVIKFGLSTREYVLMRDDA